MFNVKKVISGVLAGALAISMFSFAPEVKVDAASKVKAPASVSAKGFTTEDAVGLKFSWKEVKGADGYQYKYCLFWNAEEAKPAAEDYTEKAKLTTKKYAKVSFQDNSNVYFKVRAYKKDKNGKKTFSSWKVYTLFEKDVESILAQ